MASNAFKGMKDATRGYSSNVVREGRFLVRIDGCDFFDTNNGEKWKNTLTILAVGEGNHKVGEVVNTFWKVGSGKIHLEIFQRNVKSFVAGVLDCADEDVGEEAIETVLSGESNPLLGHVTLLTVNMRQSRDKVDEKTSEKAWYPVLSWSPAYTPQEIRDAIGDEGVARFFPNGLGDEG